MSIIKRFNLSINMGNNTPIIISLPTNKERDLAINELEHYGIKARSVKPMKMQDGHMHFSHFKTAVNAMRKVAAAIP